MPPLPHLKAAAFSVLDVYKRQALSPTYRFDTQKGQEGYYDGAYQYVGNGNHNCTVADVDNDGKDEFITGALCMEMCIRDRAVRTSELTTFTLRRTRVSLCMTIMKAFQWLTITAVSYTHLDVYKRQID